VSAARILLAAWLSVSLPGASCAAIRDWRAKGGALEPAKPAPAGALK